MSAKLLHNLSDENPDLRKQIGCMTGIFQLFDRQQFLNGRRIVSHSHKRQPPAQSQNQNHGSKTSRALQKTTEKTTSKAMKEKPTLSPESSRTSFSSSYCSSSFSSADYSKTSQPETPTYQANMSSQQSWKKSIDLRDIVKGSIHREARGLTVKTTTKKETGFPTLKYVDSPRPVTQTQFTRNKVSLLDESVQVSSLERYGGCRSSAPKDTPRFSYDERELRYGDKSTMKLKELPRLSLDSKERSIRSSDNDMKQNYHLGDVQEPQRHRQTSSIVAKLMGLEESQDLTLRPISEYRSLPRSAQTIEDGKQNCFYSSRRHSHTEAASTQMRNSDSINKPVKTSKLPVEPGPWKQPDENKDQRTASKKQTNAQISPLSAYDEIERRLKQLEFRKSGKDLRALKQILEAMEKTKYMFEGREDHASGPVPQASNSTYHIQASVMAKNSRNNVESRIVIMKPAQPNEKDSNCSSRSIARQLSGTQRIQVSSSGGNRTDRNGKQIVTNQAPRPNHHHKGPSSNPLQHQDKNINVRSVQSRQASKEAHFNMRETSRSGNSSKSVVIQKQPGRQQTEPSSPNRKSKPKVRNLQRMESGLADISCDTSLRSASNISLISRVDTGVTSKHGHAEIRDTSEQDSAEKNLGSVFQEERPMTDPVKVAAEQPSPVSVLDATLSGDESPSPVKKMSNVFKDEEPLSFKEAERMNDDPNYLSSFRNPSLSSKDYQIVALTGSTAKAFVTDETAIPYDSKNPDHKYVLEIILASGILRDPESSLITTQLLESCFPINSSVFLALEQSQVSTEVLKGKQTGKRIGQAEHAERVRRKLIFDAVNEILPQKLVFEAFPKLSIPSGVHLDKTPRGHVILQTLCSELDRLQAKNSNNSLNDENDDRTSVLLEDLMHEKAGWIDSTGEIPGIVLDIERLIFKDLINEVVSGDVAAIRDRPWKHNRKLSSK